MPSNPVTVKKDLKADWKCGKGYKRQTSRALRQKPLETPDKHPHARKPQTLAEKEKALRRKIYAYETLLLRTGSTDSPLSQYRIHQLKRHLARLREKKRAL